VRFRILVLFLITMLALPITAMRPPVQASTHLQELAAPTLAAKKKTKNKAKYKTVRRPITQTFSNAGAISIPTGTTANPYPSLLAVAGFKNGLITDVNLILKGFSHTNSEDADFLLAPAHLPGLNALVMSDVGFGPATNLTLTLDDQAPAALPAGAPLVSGTFQPTDVDSGANDGFPTQAPSGNSLLSVFNGGNPNGSWQLFARDDFGNGNAGSLSAGWALQITAEVDVKIKKKHKKKGGKKRNR
jgi:hypothetical protein